MAIKKPQIKELEALLGYTFKDRNLLAEALIHSSARTENGGRDNERLEFLGDRVLGLSIAAFLFSRLPEAREVELARHFNALVCKASCAEIARRLELGSHIIMAASEARSGGRRKEVILADACEALLGGDPDGWWHSGCRGCCEPPLGAADGTAEAPAPDAKTALQEYAQSLGWGLPEYREIGRSGADHAPNFTVEVWVKGLKPGQGTGSSLKKAQQAAAEALLKREAVWQAEQEHA